MTPASLLKDLRVINCCILTRGVPNFEKPQCDSPIISLFFQLLRATGDPIRKLKTAKKEKKKNASRWINLHGPKPATDIRTTAVHGILNTTGGPEHRPMAQAPKWRNLHSPDCLHIPPARIRRSRSDRERRLGNGNGPRRASDIRRRGTAILFL